jgi:pimeloyl-ACP methyl ester carboxylesterase
VGGPAGLVEIFEPTQSSPARAPVVMFTQGVGSDDYRGWIDHLVGRGSVVVFQNQPCRSVSLQQRRRGSVAGLRAALAELARPGHVRPRLDTIVVGHSIGAIMAAQLAADAGSQRLPTPGALFALQPPQEGEPSLRLLGRIPPSMLLLVLASDQDDRVGEAGTEALWAALAPASRSAPPATRPTPWTGSAPGSCWTAPTLRHRPLGLPVRLGETVQQRFMDEAADLGRWRAARDSNPQPPDP